ncbi:BZ3500_MvSof-1268-A1-R1_Chr5-2g07913 [Microbotryum saponariae]|uniref:Protein yippee-like n=1 Tax=Microbotryum saponariae TaxID=289078 RepID=A0A2X0NDZ1_9BASI|nr:BZ3500_MvSof-1268-A1-R1_Chr5-2g07913 [Microbotryum saponariae]SDA05782.1 BZ3501_MvSof-1269-A2-R1_Chr5-2g07735 [Microbotryum saponariae]
MSTSNLQASTGISHYTSAAAQTLAVAPLDPLTDPSVPILHALPSNVAVYRCATCSAELTVQDELVSRAFSGGTGPAYLVRTTINTYTGPKATKQLLTGKHIVSPLYCKGCQIELGWTYHVAPDRTQKYKEHKSILEEVRLFSESEKDRMASNSGLI